MKALFSKYIDSISLKFSREQTSEMGYRKEFETLLEGVFESLGVKEIDHDAKAKKGNKPDFAVLKNTIPIVYLEVKDIGVSLDKIEKSDQMTRYFGYSNLVLSDYVEFRFYRNGIRYEEPIKIGEVDLKNRSIRPLPDNFEHLGKTLLDFATSHREPIRSGEHLAKIMGGKGQRIRDNIKQFLNQGSGSNEELEKVYESIKKLLVHDLEVETFADMYAQTLIYGLFVARYYDESPENFSRQEARDLIPASNPFLQHFFDHIAGPKFDKRLSFIVDELCEIFRHADVRLLMEQYFKEDLWGEKHAGPDPVIHFYEDFLKEYDPDLRKKMGAYYTPMPVVDFIVRSVDQILQRDFGLSKGLADTEKLPNGAHRVQILDPATGTGTFLGEVIKNIYSKFTDQKGRWVSYVHHDLLPRLHGFELMMAPYTIAHLKISLELQKTGFKYFNETKAGKARLGVYLTNSLEEGLVNDSTLFSFGLAESIAEESKAATEIKNNKPIMVVLGNPPYSVSSSNKGDWIQNLIKEYKKDLNERKINLDDDYIKFLRFSEHFIEKNKTGIVAMITNNSFIDGITHRQMRKHLLETFDDIYILDLHGNSKKKEKASDGSNDENVFNIMQGVSINIFVKKEGKKKGLANVCHTELYGKREDKFDLLDKSSVEKVEWKKVDYSEPNYFFIPKNNFSESAYIKGFKIDDLMIEYNSGIQSKRDKICFTFDDSELNSIVSSFEMDPVSVIRTKYSLPEDGRDWSIEWAKKDLQSGYKIESVLYRPFDIRKTAYTGKSKGFLAYPREKTFRHFSGRSNLGLITVRQQSTFDFQHILVTKWMIESGAISLQTKEWGYVFPLYLYSDDGQKIPNLKKEIVSEIEKITGEVLPENILDYIYAILHSPSYRKKYKEFLKIDFPRVSYPKDKKQFFDLVKLGEELRQIHLLESPKINQPITTYPFAGSDVVEKIIFKDGKVFINQDQYFGNVPEVAWNFYVGGYQPAQKWLKDRKGRELTNSDIEHYQKIITALVETERIMKEIDKVVI